MAVLTLPKFKLGKKTVTSFKDLPVPIDMPPLTVESPRQELHRLLDKAVHERGVDYRDRSHRPVSERGGKRDYGCIMGYLVGLKGVSANELHARGLDHYLEQFGWDMTLDDRTMVSVMISMNDYDHNWGEIQYAVRRDFPVSA